MNIHSPNHVAFTGIAPFAINEMRENLKAKGATIEEYDEFIQTLASDHSGDDIRIETRLPDGRSRGRFRVTDGIQGFDLGILYTLKDAIEYANNLVRAKYSRDKDEKLGYLEKAQKVMEPTIFYDYGWEGSERLQKNMKQTAGLVDTEA